MRNEVQKFHETVGILVKAYLNDTLAHKMCTACAVGNLVAHRLNETQIKGDNLISRFDCWHWNGVGVTWWHTLNRHRDGRVTATDYQIQCTGYTIDEIDQIERAFESVDPGDINKIYWGEDDAYMLRGLFAVVDCLADIHKIDLTQKEQAKALFVKTL